ncbi:alpha/beta hydrolase-fold protein, partial [Vibrio cidicii]|uniref:alpha/beta hydrolase-fold protein n=1 Tax=Vibrio cidicii TaxID=1763883 RepID=UPI0037044594
PSVDPACSDSAKYGKVETFITRDVVSWISSNFNVIHAARAWTVAGYSNGGACALTYAAKYPDIWGNVVDISGEEFPGQEHPSRVLAQIFGGNQAAYDAQIPAKVFARHKYADTVGIFTVGSNDPEYVSRVKRSFQAARSAGVTATYYEVPDGGHVLGALLGGLREGFTILYPRLELAQPEGPTAESAEPRRRFLSSSRVPY